MPEFVFECRSRPLKFSPIITIEIYCFRGCYVIVNSDANARFSVTVFNLDSLQFADSKRQEQK